MKLLYATNISCNLLINIYIYISHRSSKREPSLYYFQQSLASSGRWSARSCHPLHDDDNTLERICPTRLAGQVPPGIDK